MRDSRELPHLPHFKVAMMEAENYNAGGEFRGALDTLVISTCFRSGFVMRLHVRLGVEGDWVGGWGRDLCV